MKNRALGRGLSSLLNEEVTPVMYDRQDNVLDIDEIEAGDLQPRKIFDHEKIKELANSIVSNGLVQPIIVNKNPSGKYKIIAGERRYRACRLAGMKKIPVIIKDISNREVLEIALIENIQREELNIIEEAEGFEKLMKEFGYNQSELGAAVGKSRSHVANILRLNQLPEPVKMQIIAGDLSMGHARSLVGIEDAEELAMKIVANNLNVRQTEELVRKKNADDAPVRRNNQEQANKSDDDLVILGQTLTEKFGVKVVIENSWGHGKISFHYNNLEELDSILARLD